MPEVNNIPPSSLILVDKVPTPFSGRNPMNHNRFSGGIPKFLPPEFVHTA